MGAESVFVASFNAHLRANDTLNMGDRIGTFSYVTPEVPNLMAYAQTRSQEQSRLKCKFDRG